MLLPEPMVTKHVTELSLAALVDFLAPRRTGTSTQRHKTFQMLVNGLDGLDDDVFRVACDLEHA